MPNFEAANLKRALSFTAQLSTPLSGPRNVASSASNRNRPSSASNTRIDDDEMNGPRRKEWGCSHQRESGRANVASQRFRGRDQQSEPLGDARITPFIAPTNESRCPKSVVRVMIIKD